MTISSYIQGGLGNQMFQYAIARSLSQYYKVDFILDCSWFKNISEGVTPRSLELLNLQIDQDLFKEGKQLGKSKKIILALQYLLPFSSIIKKQKNAFYYDESLYYLKTLKRRNLLLYGYWQSYRYFDQIREILKIDFEPRLPLPSTYQEYLKTIQDSESVMVHIRRGDYVSSPSASAFHGALDIQYYDNAMNCILKKFQNAHFFVFSDDLTWAKSSLPKNLKITYVEINEQDKSAPHELQLMTFCKHHIIANSSFSWWGAWLKKTQSGEVYAPSRWTNDPSLDLSNLLPKSWTRLSA